MKSIRCDILDWHRPTIISEDGVNMKSICNRCKRPIMKDSQGNWFSYGEKDSPYVEYADCQGENNRPEEPKRKFIRIITTYYPDDLICYKEYKGKPYFSIEYQENGETIVGYGTFNPDILSGYLRDYFIMKEATYEYKN